MRRHSEPPDLNTKCLRCAGRGFVEVAPNGDPYNMYWTVCVCNPEHDDYSHEGAHVRGVLADHGFSLDDPDSVTDALENRKVYEALYEYYAFNLCEMPYGTMKARTGDPGQWIMERISTLA